MSLLTYVSRGGTRNSAEACIFKNTDVNPVTSQKCNFKNTAAVAPARPSSQKYWERHKNTFIYSRVAAFAFFVKCELISFVAHLEFLQCQLERVEKLGRRFSVRTKYNKNYTTVMVDDDGIEKVPIGTDVISALWFRKATLKKPFRHFENIRENFP